MLRGDLLGGTALNRRSHRGDFVVQHGRRDILDRTNRLCSGPPQRRVCVLVASELLRPCWVWKE
jgi:hypothetical protein